MNERKNNICKNVEAQNYEQNPAQNSHISSQFENEKEICDCGWRMDDTKINNIILWRRDDFNSNKMAFCWITRLKHRSNNI